MGAVFLRAESASWPRPSIDREVKATTRGCRRPSRMEFLGHPPETIGKFAHWEWQVQDGGGVTIMNGWEKSRANARYQGYR
jgi:hypothetical protein